MGAGCADREAVEAPDVSVADVDGTDTGVVTDTADSLVVDVTGASDVNSDAAGTDASAAGVWGACTDDSGSPGCPCAKNDDCNSDFCIETAAGSLCTTTCVNTCVAGFSCVVAPGSDAVFICAPSHPTLCNPCTASKDCEGLGKGIRVCLSYGPAGSFCGSECAKDGDCPAGYACDSAKTVEGVPSAKKQCIKQDNDDKPFGACACSALATAKALSTVCVKTLKDPGGADVDCKGTRVCGPEGLTDCTASEPDEETCDGLDNDCDGKTDEESCDDDNACTTDACEPGKGGTDGKGGCLHTDKDDATPCDDGSVCTKGDACAAGKCKAGAAKDCGDDEPCTKDSCDVKSGDCKHIADDGKLCDDGQPCTEKSTCKAGKCQPGENKNCKDLGVCLTNKCDPLSGNCTAAEKPNNTACPDEDKCTEEEKCKDGHCKWVIVNCNDKNPCTTDTCKADAGCTNTNNSKPCDDGENCTLGDVCQGGACIGKPRSCTTDDPCETAKCDKTTGKCVYPDKPHGTACDDKSACTKNDACADGACAGKAKDCNDNNPCTEDSCKAATGCEHLPNKLPCNDNDACTADDTCSSGKCAGAVVACKDATACVHWSCDKQAGCVKKLKSGTCDDGVACTKGDACSGGICQGEPVKCEQADTCRSWACDSKSGKCAATDLGGTCSDGNKCTEADECKAGKCLGTKFDFVKKCNDDDPCTKDVCKETKGCVHEPLTNSPCDDNNACTEGDTCQSGVCTAGSDKCPCKKDADCDDKNMCNGMEYCDKSTPGKFVCKSNPETEPAHLPCSETQDTVCQHNTCQAATGDCAIVKKTDGVACDDGSQCTHQEACDDGYCLGKLTAKCDDGKLCTSDACDPKKGCVYLSNTRDCDEDANKCTVDTCKDKVCVPGPQKPCDDHNVCTTDSCNKKTGDCAFVAADGEGCDADGSVCTPKDACKESKCAADKPKSCDDGNPCTTDECDAKTGCTHVANSDLCNADDDKCTVGDGCKEKVCVPGNKRSCDDGDVCTADGCDKATGKCTMPPEQDGTPCDKDNSLCTVKDACVEGKCTAGTALDCDDGNPCTTDGCDPKTECTHVANTAACDADANKCTVGDQCKDKHCIAGTPRPCDDGNVCTNDTCDKATGACKAPPKQDGFGCDADSSVCTVKDGCKEGKCTAGPAEDCDDGKVCTTDSCDPKAGCVNTANTAPCDDGNACTKADVCQAEACKGVAVDAGVVCDDGNPCTTDGCDPKAATFPGCTHANHTKPCDDGSECTDKDVCAGGKCQPGADLCEDCKEDVECASKDKDLCNGTLFCDKSKKPYACVDDPKTIVTCDTSKDPQCKQNTCAKATGKCALVTVNEGKGCDADGSVCTVGDVCKGGTCTAGADKKCDDANVCTDDTCDKAKGCVNANNTATCDDKNACTANDACSNGGCKGQAKTCDDNNPCTSDSCAVSVGCSFVANTLGCDDASACTVDDKCADKVCKSGGAKGCDDGNVCTTNSCDAKTGCKTVDNEAKCPDDNACTEEEVCKSGSCTKPAVKCDDGNECTDDKCDTIKGCVSTNNTAACPDANPCTVDEKCTDGTCIKPKKACDDGNPCTNDSCPGTDGCKFANADDGAKCGADKVCATGKCVDAGLGFDFDHDGVCTGECPEPKKDTCPTVWNPDNDPKACAALGAGWSKKREVVLSQEGKGSAWPRTNEVVEVPLVNGRVDANVAAYWKLDGTLASSAPGALTVSAYTTTKYGPGVFGAGSTSMEVLPSGTGFKVADSKAIQLLQGSIMTWVYLDKCAEAFIYRKGDNQSYTQGSGALSVDTDCTLHFNGSMGGLSAPVAAGRWLHVAATWGATSMRLFVDGELADHADKSTQYGIVAKGSPASVGSSFGTYSLNGRLDDFVLANRAFSPAEIATYVASKAPFGTAYVPGARPDFGDVRVTETTPFQTGQHTTHAQLVGRRPPSADDPLMKDVVAYWKLDGDTWDSTGRYHGVFGGAEIEPVLGKNGAVGGALRFDSKSFIDTRAQIPISGTDDFTLETWVRCGPGSGGNKIMGASALGGVPEFQFHIHDKLVWFYMSFAAVDKLEYKAAGLCDGSWRHIGVVRSIVAKKLRLYVDGVLKLHTESKSGGTFNPGEVAPYIGAMNANGADVGGFIGDIDEVIVHRVAKDDAYMTQRAKGTEYTPKQEPGLPRVRFLAHTDRTLKDGAYPFFKYTLHWVNPAAKATAPALVGLDKQKCDTLLSPCLGYVAWWRFDTHLGDVTHDATSARRALLRGGAAGYNPAAGRAGGGYRSDAGVGHAAITADAAAFNLKAYTIEASIKPENAAADRGLVALGKTPGSGWLELLKDSGVARANHRSAAGTAQVSTKGALPAKTWSQVACTYDGKSLALFLNAVERGKTAAAAPKWNGGKLHVGALFDGSAAYNSFDGDIDDVRIMNRALTEDEQLHYPKASWSMP